MFDIYIYKYLGDSRFFGVNYIKQLFIIFIISLFLPHIVSFLSFTNILYIGIFITFLLQCYVLAPRINDMNKSPSHYILLFGITWILLSYFGLNYLSWILLLIAGLIPSSTNSYFGNKNTILSKIIEVKSEPDTIIDNKTSNQNIKGDSTKLIKTLLFGISIGLGLSLLMVSIGFYIFYMIFGILVGSIVTIISIFISIGYGFQICKKGLTIYSNEIGVESKNIISRFFWHIVAPCLIEIILIVGFILGFGQREGYIISLICIGVLFFIVIIHISMIWYRLGMYLIPLLKSQDTNYINNIPLPFFLKYKFKTIETKADTVFNNIYLPIIIFIIIFTLGILASNGVFG